MSSLPVRAYRGLAAVGLIFCFTNFLAAKDIPLRAANNGAVIWRPYQAPITWTGGADTNGFAQGQGQLVVYDRQGREIVALIDGTMTAGYLKGSVSARYPKSPDRMGYVGEFSNWSENGNGTMTMKDGTRVQGFWREGEFIGDITKLNKQFQSKASAYQMLLEIQWPAVEKAKSLDAQAQSALQIFYDHLKIILPPAQREELVQSQRAWLGFTRVISGTARNYWGNRTDLEARSQQLDVGMTLHRLAEIDLAIRLLGNPAKLGEANQFKNFKELGQAINKDLSSIPAGLIPEKKTPTMILEQFGRVISLFKIAGALQQQDQQKLVADNLANAILRHTNEQYDFWHNGRWLSEPPYEPLNVAQADAKLAAELGQLRTVISDQWGMGGAAPPNWMPSLMPQKTKDRVTAALNDFAIIRKEDPTGILRSETDKQWIGKALVADDFLIARNRNSSEALKTLDALAADPVEEWVPWIQSLSARMQQDLKKNEALLVEIQKMVAEGDPVKLGFLLEQSQKLAPDEEGSKLAAVVGIYDKLFGKPMVPEDGKPHSLTPADLPVMELLKESVQIAKNFDECGGDMGHPMKEVLLPYSNALSGADLLRIFLENAGTPAQGAFPTPLLGLKAMRTDPRFSKLREDKHPLIARAMFRLLAIEKRLAESDAKMTDLVAKGDAALKDRKWAEASRSYRLALAIEDWPLVREQANKAERNLSGL